MFGAETKGGYVQTDVYNLLYLHMGKSAKPFLFPSNSTVKGRSLVVLRQVQYYVKSHLAEGDQDRELHISEQLMISVLHCF